MGPTLDLLLVLLYLEEEIHTGQLLYMRITLIVFDSYLHSQNDKLWVDHVISFRMGEKRVG